MPEMSISVASVDCCQDDSRERARGETRGRCRSRWASQLGSPLAFILLFAALLGADYLHRRWADSFEPAIRPEGGGHEDEAHEEFIWSEKLQDWTLADRQVNATLAGESRLPECLWPNESNCERKSGDRIVEQLRFTPRRLANKVIKIALAHEFAQPEGRAEFLRQKCPIDKCRLTNDLYEAQVVIFRDADVSSLKRWPRLLDSSLRWRQIWIAHLLESPSNTFDKRFERAHRSGRHAFNWTATYRTDSDLVTPYSKFVPFERSVGRFIGLRANRSRPTESDADTKMKRNKVAWFVSNCHAQNQRLEYARQLALHIQVDIYGKCGNLTCPKWSQNKCLEHLNSHYKFYLSFENSNHREYITEKLYQNAYGFNDLKHKLVPIVMGPKRQDYERLVPPASFIHVDDFGSPRELAAYLHELDETNIYMARISSGSHSAALSIPNSYAEFAPWLMRR